MPIWTPRRFVINVSKFISGLLLGAIMLGVIVKATAGPGMIILSQEEAVGDQFSDPALLDIDVKVDRRRNCPTMTQRYVWRWVEYKGKQVQQAMPMEGTFMPFFPDHNDMILTLPNPGVPDINDKWYYRTVSAEWCGIMPTASLNGWLGTNIYKSRDQRVTFIGTSVNTK